MLAMTVSLLIAGCTQPQQQVQTPPSSPVLTPVQTDTVRVATSPLGTILTDAGGQTLYYFATDVPASGASSCSGKCATVWPIFSTDTIRVSTPLNPADFGSIMRADGTKQTTYYGWPLYYYQADAKPGDVNGENVLKVWYVMKPDESVMITQSPALGQYLTDTSGKTLYVFTKDSTGTSTCTGSCLAKWPAFSASTVTAPSVLKPSGFSAISRADGVNQTAWMGMPLYYYSGDTKPGDVNGQGFNNVWYVANVSGITPVVTTIPVTVVPTTSASTGYSSGY